MYSETWRLLTITLSVMAAAIQVAGLVAPVWIWLYDDEGEDEEYAGVGLFFRVGYEPDNVSPMPKGFEKVDFISDQTLNTKHWVAMASAEVISTFFAFILIFALIHFNRRANSVKKLYHSFRIAVWFSVFPWLLNALGLVIFLIYHSDILRQGPQISALSFSWGGLICAVGFVLHVALTLIIFQCIWPNEDEVKPGATDQQLALNTSPTNANISGVFDAYYRNNGNRLAIQEVQEDRRPSGGVRLPIMPPQEMNRNIPDRMHVHDRVNIPYPRARSPPLIVEPPRRLSTDGRRVESIYSNAQHEFRNVNGHAGFDNQGFAHPSPLGHQRDVQRIVKTTVLDRDDRFDNVNRGGIDKGEVVFNRIPQHNDGPRRSSLFRELDNITAARKKSGDFLVTAKHGNEKDVHRDNGRYLSHTARPSDQDSPAGQRLVLSPSNFTDNNVKYNPTFMYRPYSEKVY